MNDLHANAQSWFNLVISCLFEPLFHDFILKIQIGRAQANDHKKHKLMTHHLRRSHTHTKSATREDFSNFDEYN